MSAEQGRGERETVACPICFTSIDDDDDERQFVTSGSCSHVFCLPCLDRWLLAPSLRLADQQQDNDAAGGIPTFGSCPICRSEMSYFDLEYYKNGAGPVVVASGELDPRLKGAIYATTEVQGQGAVGWPRFHFEEEPYIMDTSKAPMPMGELLYFESFKYHSGTHTFEGRLRHKTKDDVVQLSRFILSFSDNFHFVIRGAVVHTILDFDEAKESMSLILLCFDGHWRIQPSSMADTADDSSSSNPLTGRLGEGGQTVHISGSMFRLPHEEPFFFLRRSGSGVSVVDATDAETVLMTAAWNWQERPEGPNQIGDSLHWSPENDTSTDSEHQRLFQNLLWTRQTQPDPPPKTVIQRIGGSSGVNYRRLDSSKRTVSDDYNGTSVWGNTFCQANKVGLASYHFVTDDLDDNGSQHAYISYEHPDVALWGALDNGRPIPSQVRFRNISFPAPHIFRGDICWLQDYGTSWQESVRWEYEMHFDTEFMCILSGTVRSVSVHDDTATEMSRFGDSLVYCNAALFDEVRRRCENNSDIAENSEDESAGGQATAVGIRRRLQEEGISVPTLAMIRTVLAAAVNVEGETPFDYNV